MSKSVAESVSQAIKPIVDGLGCELVEVDYSKKNTGAVMTVFIDKVGGVTIEDCVAVHEAIDAPLDELDPTNNAPYTLNVSSPGLDRPIKTDSDLEKNLGQKLEANTFVKIGTKKHFEGVLVEFNAETITLEIDGKPQVIARENISKLNKYIEF